MPFIARQRSRLAVLAVLALVGSLLAVSAVPAVAAGDGEPTESTTASACVGAATESAGFTDMAGSFAEAAADCLAHYGVTKGTAAGVFSPNASVTRLQMALFLSRAAGPAGLALPAGSDQGLTDIGGMSGEIQTAINQMAASGIMAARSAGTFDPTGMVTREDMAVHLDGFLTKTDEKITDFDPDDEIFTDISGVTYAAYGSIRKLYELGVTTGTSDTMFSPDALVTRGQMAAFITRTLAHTNARPAGLSIQGSTSVTTDGPVTVTVSVRDSDHQPIPDAVIDIFQSPTPDDQFNADGTCTSGDCKIDNADIATDSDGEAPADSLMLGYAAATLTVWAWTGALDDTFDLDETDHVTHEIDVALPATATKVSTDLPENADYAKFGDTVTVTFQLVNDDDGEVAEAGRTIKVRTVTTESGGNSSDTTATHKTDASGRIQLSFSQDDPDPDSDDDANAIVVLSLIKDEIDTAAPKVENPGSITWSGKPADPTTLTLGQAVSYHDADDDGVRNTITATLTDQYGDPVKNAEIIFSSTDVTAGLGKSDGAKVNTVKASHSKLTRANGVATAFYTRKSDDGFAEVISAFHDVGDNDGERNGKFDKDDETEAEDITHYWAEQAVLPADGKPVSDLLVVADTDNNVVVIASSDGKKVFWASYKSGDQFSVDDTASSLDAFEKALDQDAEKATVAITINGEDAVNVFAYKKNS